jgi:hypothetical protein
MKIEARLSRAKAKRRKGVKGGRGSENNELNCDYPNGGKVLGRVDVRRWAGVRKISGCGCD